EVLEIDVVDDPKEGGFRVALGCAVGVGAEETQRDGSIHEHPKASPDEPCHHGPETALGIEPLPKHAKEENDKNRRSEVTLHRLQVVVEPGGAFDDRDPG